MDSTRRSPGERAGLTRESVLAAARGLLEDEGGPALSLRAVARRLGVAPNALYSHVSGAPDLLDAVLDDLLSTVAAPARSLPVRTGLLAVLLSSYDVLVGHPELVPHYLSRRGVRGPQGQRLGAAMDELLHTSGVADVDAARNALLVHLLGSAAFASSSRRDEPALPPDAARDLYALAAGWLVDGILAGARRGPARPRPSP